MDLERAHAIAEAWADFELDLVDCTSFAVMERLACTRAATFGPGRKHAFEILG